VDSLPAGDPCRRPSGGPDTDRPLMARTRQRLPQVKLRSRESGRAGIPTTVRPA